MERISRIVVPFLVLLNSISGVECSSSDVIGMSIAGGISFLLFVLVIMIVAVSCSWSQWIRNWMRSRGKVRMPKAYFKKKEEAKRRLLSGNMSHTSASVANGNLPAQSVDRVNENGNAVGIIPAARNSSRASWVQGWSQRTNAFSNGYEEKDATLELGEEQDDEFKIETVLVDNEVLDVGPFKNAQPDEEPTDGDIYPEPYIYTTIDKTSFRRDNNVTTTTTTAEEAIEMVEVSSMPGEMRETAGDIGGSQKEEIYRFEDIVDLVSL